MTITSILRDQKERTRFLRFSVVGAIGAVVDFGSFHILESVVGVKAVWASVFSFTAAITSNFIWNRFWTYPDSRSKPIYNQLVTFFIVNIIGLVIRTPIFVLLESPLRDLFDRLDFLPLGLINADRLGYTFALGVAVVVVMFWNFFVNRYWTYNDIE